MSASLTELVFWGHRCPEVHPFHYPAYARHEEVPRTYDRYEETVAAFARPEEAVRQYSRPEPELMPY